MDACLSGNYCSSQLSGFHNMLLCRVADFVLQLVVDFLLFSVNIVYSIIAMFTFYSQWFYCDLYGTLEPQTYLLVV